MNIWDRTFEPLGKLKSTGEAIAGTSQLVLNYMLPLVCFTNCQQYVSMTNVALLSSLEILLRCDKQAHRV
jgi:hypothetical protein